MECNKEEAIRAKGIAEKKMENKDFSGARKIAVKAQQLHPDLENISQMIMVCDVHCAAENKVYGNEKDWYGILQVQTTADEASIKRQYRKFALLLHPDKNKFAGAADAFKLIGEAQRVLLDREKRMLHDKCRASRPMAQHWASQSSTCNSDAGRQPWVKNHSMSKTNSPFTAFHPQQQQQRKQTQPGFPTEKQTFWTVCPFCSVRYQFYREVINRLLWCQSCRRSFTGHEIKTQATGSGAHSSQPPFQQQNDAFKTNMQVPKAGAQGNASSEKQTGQSFSRTGDRNVDVNVNGKVGGMESKLKQMNAKKRKLAAESSESCSTGSSSDSEEEIAPEENGDVTDKQNFGCYGEHPRRSSRSKRHVSYNENLSDDDDDVANPVKRSKCDDSFRATEDPLMNQEEAEMKKPDNHSSHMAGDVNEVRQKKRVRDLQNEKEESEEENREIKATKDGRKTSESKGEFSLDSSPSKSTDPEVYEYPDPDFNDFDEDRREECFKVGQIWAAYDTLDAMPRFYARIKKVFSPGFKLRITWLEPDPDDEAEIKWVEEGLPVSCGKFRNGNTENTEDHPMFSHLLYWEKGSRADTYKIYPRRGETWALFKNWNMKWYSNSEHKRKFEFEFVEVLSDYAEDIGVSVAYLGKIKGFSCLFCRTVKEGIGSFQIPPNQIFRFSHRIPSIPMTGEEREDVPKGSFELDPASLPTNLEEIAVSEDVKMVAAKIHSDVSCSQSPTEKMKSVTASEANASRCQVNKKSKSDPQHITSNNCTKDLDDDLPSTPEPFEIPESEFYNFEVEKFPEKFQVGQIWALYSDEDGLPKYYAQIKKIDCHPEFKLHITWLAPCPPKNIIQWHDRKMPVSCSMFRVQKGLAVKYAETSPFSHQLSVELTEKKDVYAIYPKQGEVWALYKCWNPRIKCSELKTCEYDIVEILKEDDFEIRALVLERVDGFNSVFKAKNKGGSALTMSIVRDELLRFSHQIPAYQLKEERGGILRGYWELDPAALPISFFHSS
ncbi:hypothetical protein NMG60_11025172 [Bertholletia excelsa]